MLILYLKTGVQLGFWCKNIIKHQICFEKDKNTHLKTTNFPCTTRISSLKYVSIVFYETNKMQKKILTNYNIHNFDIKNKDKYVLHILIYFKNCSIGNDVFCIRLPG